MELVKKLKRRRVVSNKVKPKEDSVENLNYRRSAFYALFVSLLMLLSKMDGIFSYVDKNALEHWFIFKKNNTAS